MKKFFIPLEREHASVNMLPNKCPQCHKWIHIESKNKIGDNTLNNAFEAVFKCPSCLYLFISMYCKDGKDSDLYNLKTCHPYKPENLEIDENVKEVSPLFCEIYTQAKSAEQYNLDQIAGLGYRKALEFLIKDFCIIQNPQDSETIKQLLLAQCIDRLENEKIKQAAKRATWLGNDEAHYTRKFEDKDVNDLKILLQIVQAHIVHEVMFKKYIDEM